MTARKAPAKPVANLAAARKEQQAARKQAQAAHPAGKAQPKPAQKPAAKKPAPAKAAKPAKPATGPHQGVVRAGVVSRGGTSRGGSRRGGSSGVVPPDAAEKRTYEAVGRGGVARTQQSASPLAAAVDCKIGGRRGKHFADGAVIAFYASREKAEAAAASINNGEAGPDWTDAIVTAVKAVS